MGWLLFILVFTFPSVCRRSPNGLSRLSVGKRASEQPHAIGFGCHTWLCAVWKYIPNDWTNAWLQVFKCSWRGHGRTPVPMDAITCILMPIGSRSATDFRASPLASSGRIPRTWHKWFKYGVKWGDPWILDPWFGDLEERLILFDPYLVGDSLLSGWILYDSSTGLRGISSAIWEKS